MKEEAEILAASPANWVATAPNYRSDDDSDEGLASELDYETERDKPMPNKIHGLVQTQIVVVLAPRLRQKFNIATEVSLDTPGKPSTPDVLVMKKEPFDYFDDAPRVTDPPLVAIEIMSPSQGFSIFKEKAARYFEFGVKSFWVVDPPYRTIRVFSAARKFESFSNSDILHDPSIGVEIPLAEIFV